MGYQESRSTESKFLLISSGLDMRRVRNVLDIGCNEGKLTALFTAEGLFGVGLDVKPHFAERVTKEKSGAAFGVLPMSQQVAERLPEFDLILLLSVHHQWHKSWGEQRTQMLLEALARKATAYFVVEFSALGRKYGFDGNAPFTDNDEASVIAYGTDQLTRLNIPGATVRYLGRNPERAGVEPYRYSFVVEKRQDL